MTTTASSPTPAAARGTTPSGARLTWLHLKDQFLETVRVPIAVLGNLLFPALAMFFFVVPQSDVAGDPVFATESVASLPSRCSLMNRGASP